MDPRQGGKLNVETTAEETLVTLALQSGGSYKLMLVNVKKWVPLCESSSGRVADCYHMTPFKTCVMRR